MSDFNTANELAAALIWGRTYQGDKLSADEDRLSSRQRLGPR
jgi:hypothetical protein